jgi:LacI family transcriptional regulator
VSADWDILLDLPSPEVLQKLRRWRPDGAIVRIANPSSRRAMLRLGVPVVNVLTVEQLPEAAAVGQENGEVGRLAAEYFFTRGHSSFAYVGAPWERAQQKLRETEFVRAVGDRGGAVQVFEPRGSELESAAPRLVRWLRGLPRPTALLAHYDVAGRNVVEAARKAGLAVPQDISVLGVDDDDVFCELSRPRLSSIAFPWRRMGQAAAELMARFLAGGAYSPERVLLPPDRVVTRESTDMTCLEDMRLRRAIEHIHLTACKGLSVNEVARAAGLSRRMLERRFRTRFSQSVLEEIVRVRLRKAQELLLTTDLSVKEVAHQSGFGSSERLCVCFRVRTGQTPTEFRIGDRRS